MMSEPTVGEALIARAKNWPSESTQYAPEADALIQELGTALERTTQQAKAEKRLDALRKAYPEMLQMLEAALVVGVANEEQV